MDTDTPAQQTHVHSTPNIPDNGGIETMVEVQSDIDETVTYVKLQGVGRGCISSLVLGELTVPKHGIPFYYW